MNRQELGQSGADVRKARQGFNTALYRYAAENGEAGPEGYQEVAIPPEVIRQLQAEAGLIEVAEQSST